jgi:hypothetical protein
MLVALRILAIGALAVTIGGGPFHSAALARYHQARSVIQISRATAVPTCNATNLTITPITTSGATGHIGLQLLLRNVTTQTCTMKGFPTIVLLDGARLPLLTVLHFGSGGFFTIFNRPVRLVTLAPGGNAYLALGWSDIPMDSQSCPSAPNLLVLPPPDASSAVLLRLGLRSAPIFGPVVACGGQLAVSPVEPTPFRF